MLFSPYIDDINTSFMVEKRRLKVSVTAEDMDVLREGFQHGIMKLPGVKVESQDESLSDSVNFFEARFTFLEDENRRKRWVRSIYWGDGLLIMIAQGRTVEDFEYWLPMFYNTIMTAKIIYLQFFSFSAGLESFLEWESRLLSARIVTLNFICQITSGITYVTIVASAWI